MQHSSGLLNLAFPAIVSNTILRRLTTEWGRLRRHSNETLNLMKSKAKRIRFGCSLQLPTVRIAARELEHIAPGDVLRLNLSANALSEWRVSGRPLSMGRPMRNGSHRAAHIESLLTTGGGK
jgi:flagellar motor switch protein FliM